MSNAAIDSGPAQRPRCECPECSERRGLAVSLPARRRTNKQGDESLEPWGGTIVHWDERAPDDPYWSFLISCHACGHDKFTPKPSIKNPRWYGHCPDCKWQCRVCSPKKRRTLTGQHRNPFGATIDYDAPHDYNRALVYCPNYSICKGTSEKRVDASNQDKQPFYCKKCLSEQRRQPWSKKLGLVAATKRNRGRQPLTPEVARKNLIGLLARIHGEVVQLKKEGAARRDVKSNTVATRLAYGSKECGGTAMMQRAKDWGLTLDWEALRDFFWDGGQPSEVNINPPNKS